MGNLFILGIFDYGWNDLAFMVSRRRFFFAEDYTFLYFM